MNVTGSTYAGGLVGGFMGTGTVSDSHATGNVTAKDTAAGGLIGIIVAGSISRSYSTGTVVQGNTQNGAGAGGLVAIASVSNPGITSSIVTISESYTTSPVTGQTYVGGLIGLVGYVGWGGVPGNIRISDTYADNTITLDKGASGAYLISGNLIGIMVNDGSVAQSISRTYTRNTLSVAAGTVADYQSGFTAGPPTTTHQGGLIGYLFYGYGAVAPTCSNNAMVTYCIFDALNNFTFSNNYWVQDGTHNTTLQDGVGATVVADLGAIEANDGQSINVGVTNVSPLTDAQMQSSANFTGFDFTAGTGKWTMDTAVSNYPILQWQ